MSNEIPDAVLHFKQNRNIVETREPPVNSPAPRAMAGYFMTSADAGTDSREWRELGQSIVVLIAKLKLALELNDLFLGEVLARSRQPCK